MKTRIEGTTLPGYTATVIDDTRTPITNGATYTWTVKAALSTDPTHATLWTKTTGIVSTASGFTVTWAPGDLGALPATDEPVEYQLEFIGVSSAGTLKHREFVVISPQL